MAGIDLEGIPALFDGVSLDTTGEAPAFAVLAGPVRLVLDISEARQCHTELGDRLKEAEALLKGRAPAVVISEARVEQYRRQFARDAGGAGESQAAAASLEVAIDPDSSIGTTRRGKSDFESVIKIGGPGNGLFHGTIADLASAVGWGAIEGRTMLLANAVQVWTHGPRTGAPAEMLLDQIAGLPTEDFTVAAKFIIRSLAAHSRDASIARL